MPPTSRIPTRTTTARTVPMNKSLVRAALAEAKAEAKAVTPRPAVAFRARSFSRYVPRWTDREMRRTVLELGVQGHVFFLGGIRPETQ